MVPSLMPTKSDTPSKRRTGKWLREAWSNSTHPREIMDTHNSSRTCAWVPTSSTNSRCKAAASNTCMSQTSICSWAVPEDWPIKVEKRMEDSLILLRKAQWEAAVEAVLWPIRRDPHKGQERELKRGL